MFNAIKKIVSVIILAALFVGNFGLATIEVKAQDSVELVF